MKMQWTFLMGLMFAISIAVFAIVNMEKVPVDYVFGEAYWPLVLIILGSALIGAFVSACFSMFRIFTQKRRITQLDKQLAELESIVVSRDIEIERLHEDLSKTTTEHFEKDLQQEHSF